MNDPHNTTAGLLIEESDDDDNQDIDLRSINHNEPQHHDINDQPGDDESERKEDDEETDDEDDEFPISDVITCLTIAWRNEKLAPELLHYEEECVERVKQAIDDKEEEIDDLQEAIANNNNANNANYNINNKIISSSLYWYRKEIERIKYILHSYLRIRIWKIQKYYLYVMSDKETYNKLSEKEMKFVASYSDLVERHYKNCFVRDLPKKYQQLDQPEMINKPNLNQF